MLNCRRCRGKRLVELGRLQGSDHPIYRCRDCGFLFSPPDEEARAGLDARVRRSAPGQEVWPDGSGPGPGGGGYGRGYGYGRAGRRGSAGRVA